MTIYFFRYILATGFENGHIIISTWCKDFGFSVQQRLDEKYPFE